jgi:hypothetical protein
MKRLPFACMLIVAALLGGTETPRAATTAQTCSAASPTDNVDDTVNLQYCLDNGDLLIELSAGSPGYIIEHGLRLRRNGNHLTSADANNRATILAAANLDEYMIRADADDWRISHLIFDGNRFNRAQGGCSYPNCHNIIGVGSGFQINGVNSSFARGGSAMEITGSDFEIYDNVVAYNGWSQDEYNGQWSDGMTIHRCTNGSIHNNQIVENTDVNVVINRGSNCEFRFNDIWNFDRYAFAGLAISATTDGYHTGGVFSDNEISSGYDMLGFGLLVGLHPWFVQVVEDAGTVGWNTMTGAVINLAVDGVDAGTITSNSMSGAQGTRGYHTCLGQSALDYAVAHVGGGVSLQSGWTARACH